MSNTGHVDDCGECQESKAFRCPPCDKHYVAILKARVEELEETEMRLSFAVEGLCEIKNLSPDEARDHAARIAAKALAKATD
jgi:hypothetical protein